MTYLHRDFLDAPATLASMLLCFLADVSLAAQMLGAEEVKGCVHHGRKPGVDLNSVAAQGPGLRGFVYRKYLAEGTLDDSEHIQMRL